MPVPSSGQLSLGKIRSEIEGNEYSNGPYTANSTSMKDLEDGNYNPINTNSPTYPDLTSPHKMSEWYEYNHSATGVQYYLEFDGVNDNISDMNHPGLISNGGPYPNLSNTDYSISFWFRNDMSTKANMWMYTTMLENAPWFTRPVIRFHYLASLNRIAFEVADTSNDRVRKECVLHNNSSITGVSNSSTGWVSGQRGNTNNLGFTLLTWVYIASGDMKFFWNDTEITSLMTVDNSGFSTNIFDAPCKTIIGSHFNNNGYTGGDYDELKLYNRALNSTDVTNLWNNGNIANASDCGVTNGLVTEFSFENNLNDSANAFNMSNNGSTFKTY